MPYIVVNNKSVYLTADEYESLVVNESVSTTPPFNKMDELIDAVRSIKVAIDNKSEIDADTKYSLVKDGNIIRLTGSDGSESEVEITDNDTTYQLSVEDNKVKLKASNGTESSADLPEDKDTSYNIEFDPEADKFKLTGSDGTESVVDLSKFANDTDIEDIYEDSASEPDIDNIFNNDDNNG